MMKKLVYLLIVAILVFFLVCGCVYLKMDPPADADKPFPVPKGDGTCYMATAANMLAGAGYGNGINIQERAEDIYNQMKNHLDWGGGWTDEALDWWLTSSYNTWSNPYQVVTVYGYKDPRYPWDYAYGPMLFANKLRECSFVGLSISWPTSDSSIGDGGHAITCWGDNSIPISTIPLIDNPTEIYVTDSDTDDGGDIQLYSFDDYTNPNPGGPNEGDGWYFDMIVDNSNDHPYIKHIIVLSPLQSYYTGDEMIQRVVGSYKIHQFRDVEATDLHYEVRTNPEILSYKTSIDWFTKNKPSIIESGVPRNKIYVDWDLSDNPVPYCRWVTITTEFILPGWNAIEYNDVHFTYPDDLKPWPVPSLRWEMQTPNINDAESIKNVSGGYIVGGFDIVDPELGVNGEYRFIHQYSFNQNPEYHSFLLSNQDNSSGYKVKNLRFGHSYGYLDADELWEFGEEVEWLTYITSEYSLDNPIEISIDWDGKLPYPPGDR